MFASPPLPPSTRAYSAQEINVMWDTPEGVEGGAFDPVPLHTALHAHGHTRADVDSTPDLQMLGAGGSAMAP